MITLGLSQIMVGPASTTGQMPSSLTKIGKTYKDTCRITQDAADVTEHFEEGVASPEVRKKTKKIPRLNFSIMNADVQTLIDYIGGENVGTSDNPKWGFDGTETIENKAIKVITEQGLDFEIPNGDIEAVINSDLSSSGIFLVEFAVTPMAVSNGKALRAVPKGSTETPETPPETPLVVSPATLNFSSSANSIGQVITASSTGNITSASAAGQSWITVRTSGKTATVTVTENTSTIVRRGTVTINADGKTASVEVVQSGRSSGGDYDSGN